jgi:hypothetical protein
MIPDLSILLSQPYMPHGMCFLWQSEPMWRHVGSDAVIALDPSR